MDAQDKARAAIPLQAAKYCGIIIRGLRGLTPDMTMLADSITRNDERVIDLCFCFNYTSISVIWHENDNSYERVLTLKISDSGQVRFEDLSSDCERWY